MVKGKKLHQKMGLWMGLMVLGFSSTIWGAGNSSAQFLKMGAGARAAALGDAFTAIADDATATYWNPAGLVQLDKPEVNLMHNDGLVDTQYQFLAAAIPLKRSAIGLTLARMDYGTLDRYTPANAPDGNFDAGSTAGGLVLSGAIKENLYYGIGTKFIQEKIDNQSASGFAADLGVFFHGTRYQFGAALQNLGPSINFIQEDEDLPLTFRAGAATHFFDQKLLVGLDASKPNDNDPSIHLGLEYKLNDRARLRGGYKATPGNNIDVGGLTNVTGGLGLAFGNFGLDYAFVPFGDLDNTHRVSFKINFSKP